MVLKESDSDSTTATDKEMKRGKSHLSVLLVAFLIAFLFSACFFMIKSIFPVSAYQTVNQSNYFLHAQVGFPSRSIFLDISLHNDGKDCRKQKGRYISILESNKLDNQRLVVQARGGGGGLLNKVLFGEAPPRGPNPYLFIYHF